MDERREYQAFPYDAAFFQRTIDDVLLGSRLHKVILYLQEPHWKNVLCDTPQDVLLFQKCEELIAHRPGIQSRYFSTDNYYEDTLMYLLSEKRRRMRRSFEDDSQKLGDKDAFLWRALIGGSDIAPHVKASQGSPIRYTTPEETARVAKQFASENQSTLRDRYDIPKMLAAGAIGMVLTPFPSTPEHAYQSILDELILKFKGIKKVFTDAARHGEGVISVND